MQYQCPKERVAAFKSAHTAALDRYITLTTLTGLEIWREWKELCELWHINLHYYYDLHAVSASMHTVYCCVMAEIHGKLHMEKVSGSTLAALNLQASHRVDHTVVDMVDAAGCTISSIALLRVQPGRDVFLWTMSAQRWLINNLLAMYFVDATILSSKDENATKEEAAV